MGEGNTAGDTAAVLACATSEMLGSEAEAESGEGERGYLVSVTKGDSKPVGIGLGLGRGRGDAANVVVEKKGA